VVWALCDLLIERRTLPCLLARQLESRQHPGGGEPHSVRGEWALPKVF